MNFRKISDGDGNFLRWLKNLRHKSGVYVIKACGFWDSGILYVGESHTNSLGKTLKRHFFEWDDEPERKHFTYDRKRVKVAVKITRQKNAVEAQNRLIAKLKPRDNVSTPEPEKPF
jgi:excinuclease UvrABC nuclease subunit